MGIGYETVSSLGESACRDSRTSVSWPTSLDSLCAVGRVEPADGNRADRDSTSWARACPASRACGSEITNALTQNHYTIYILYTYYTINILYNTHALTQSHDTIYIQYTYYTIYAYIYYII